MTNRFKWGDMVRLIATGEVGVVERLGINARVYSVIPPLAGEHWHIESELELLEESDRIKAGGILMESPDLEG